VWIALPISSAIQISPAWGPPKPGGTTAGPSAVLGLLGGYMVAIGVTVPAPLTLNTLPSRHVTIMS